ncbi:FAD/NAD(P)-binding oxidoreductase [Polaromonas sp.]|uniref:FAD/NAD(P)-binding oxidoreductase n=1 Tax=Polaromonas sp. TaxID=1869339 RepID=UPI00286AD0D3|nr:FAD/NAD(P)-binding oxidoreductase [Polaromonas sp.]
MNQRREFLGALAAAGLGLTLPGCGGGGGSSGDGTVVLHSEISRLPVVPDTGANGSIGRVVVVGGGMSGAAMAKYLRLWGGTGVNVTLVERERSYTTNISSNLVLNGSRQISNLVFQYDRLRAYGVDVRTGDVTGITPSSTGGSIRVGSASLPYDRLVLAPGIDFDVIPGLESQAAQDRVPHAWKAGVQTTTLRDQLRAMRAGGTFIIGIPPTPFRAATAPYERACIVADFFRSRNPSAKIIVLDANANFAGGAATFGAAFSGRFAGIITRIPSALVTAIDASVTPIRVAASVTSSTGVVSQEVFLGDVVNAIPRQKAGAIVTGTGLNLTAGGRFAPVNVLSYESTQVPGIHVVGDSCSAVVGDPLGAVRLPKAGHMGNQQGKIGADAIVRLLQRQPLDPSPATATVGFSPITADTASWFTTVYQAQTNPGAPFTMVASRVGEAANPTGDNFENLFKWFGELHADTLA